MRSLDFSIDLILPAALWPLGSTELLREMSTSNFPLGGGVKGPQRVRLTSLLPSMSPMSRICESLDHSHPFGSSWPVSGTASFTCYLYLTPLLSKHSPQHPVLNHLQSCVLPLMSETKFHTYTKLQEKL
jgi:hypothetical protein